MKKFEFNDRLREVNLIVDAIYEGGRTGNVGDDPINKILPGSGVAFGLLDEAKQKILSYCTPVAKTKTGQIAWIW